jgi:signal transduction histidine kinase
MAHTEPLSSASPLRRGHDHHARTAASAGSPPLLPAASVTSHGLSSDSRASAATPSAEVREARKSMLMAAAALIPYFIGVWLVRDDLGFRMEYVAPMFAGAFLVNVLLAATAQYWSHSRWLGLIYGCPQVLMLTAILYFLGGLQVAFLVLLFSVTLYRTAVLGTPAAVFVTANVATLCFGFLAVTEVYGWLPVQAGFVANWTAPPGLAGVAIFATWIVLNLIAFYASRSGQQLRNFASHLQERVKERTVQLTSVNAELATKARALEEKQAELRTVVDAVTHELKNPLNAILLTADLLRESEDITLSAEAREDLERIIRLAGNTEDMIRDLLRLFEITTADEAPCSVDLKALMGQALETLQPQISAKRVKVHVGPLPRVRGQERKLLHVATNLLANAIKYVSTGRGAIDVTGHVAEGRTVLCVRDNGIGIAPAYHVGIFDLFRRVPESEQQVDGEAVAGSGVGLAVVQRIVEAHGGAAWVESQPGLGSRFYISIPSIGADAGRV